MVLACLVLLIVCNSGINTLSAQSVRSEDLKEWISYLASDEMKGRANGSPEMKTAAGWISEMFIEAGLKPLLQDGSYIQNYSFIDKKLCIAIGKEYKIISKQLNTMLSKWILY